MVHPRFRYVVMLAACVGLLAATSASAATPARSQNPFCQRLGKTIEASSGAQMFCFGLQRTGPSHARAQAARRTATTFTPNVDAATPSEDVSPSGTAAYGQSETSVAATGRYVVEAWNDATAFFTSCPAPMSKEEGTGYGFSSDGGATFTDEGGVPNANCHQRLLEGDPSVEAWAPGGHATFYIASLYPSVSQAPVNDIAVNACQVSGTSIHCGQPVVAAASTSCRQFQGFEFCGFLDKEYLSLDPTRGRLYVSYTEFGPTPTTSSFNGQIDLAVCDIGTPSGGSGPAGGTAAKPRCEHGTTASATQPNTQPYLVLQPGDRQCQNEGAYPAADTASGDVYVAWEFNQASNVFNPACFNTPTQERLARVPAACLVLRTTSPCSPPATRTAENIVSMDAAFIPGYNRFPANDFPRIAVDSPAGTVSIAWNDARFHPLGDILLRSYALGSLNPATPGPVVLDSDGGGMHFLPALRYATHSGKLDVTWYDRTNPNSTITDVRGALGISPTLGSTPSANTLVTDTPSDWNSVSSDIVPNFGDYTDNYIAGGRLYVAWSDGRIGVPQPFEANAASP